MKTKPSRTKAFNSKLAAYSATATAALLAAPAADATIQNITGPFTGLNLPGNESFSAGPLNGSFNGTHGIYKHIITTAGFSTPGVHLPGHFGLYPNSARYYPGISFPGMHFPGRPMTVSTQWHGKANINGSIAGLFFASNLSKGAAFSGLNFSNGNHLLAYKTNHSRKSGNFLTRSGYVALKAGSYYGWLKVKVSQDSHGAPNFVQLVDNGDGIYGAFDKTTDASGDNFKVGDIAPVPEPSIAAIGGLGLLALGAVGVREMRRRRKAETKN